MLQYIIPRGNTMRVSESILSVVIIILAWTTAINIDVKVGQATRIKELEQKLLVCMLAPHGNTSITDNTDYLLGDATGRVAYAEKYEHGKVFTDYDVE